MTEKEKARAYDEAIEKLRSLHDDYDTVSTLIDIKEELECIFPELKESDDEKTMKEIAEFIYNSVFKPKDIKKKEKWLTWFEKLAERKDNNKDNNKLIWKHWSTGIAGNGDGEPIYLIKHYNTYSISSCLSFECDYILLSDLDKLISDGDVDIRYKYLENILKADNIYQMSMNDTMVEEAKSKATEALSKMAIGKLLGIKNQSKQNSYGQREECLDCQFNYAGECKGSCQMKRDEQKHVNKVEPKFKVGDWLQYRNTKPFFVEEITKQGYVNGNSCLPFNWENEIHLWTIQDAKDGDVLNSIGWDNNCIFIFNGLDNWKFDEPNGDRAVATGYCCLSASADKMEFGMQGPDCVEVNTVKPATKEQRDTLMKAMADAGYTFDFEKKELKKIDDSVEKAIHKAGYEWSEDTHQLKKIDCNANEYEWSTDDEQYLLVCKNALAKYQTTNHWDANIISQWLDNKLKSIRTEQKSAWSEEDERLLESTTAFIEANNTFCSWKGKSKKDILHWLKSLKDRYTWKPSKEQIIALRWVLNNIPYSKYKEEIYGLLDQIKEL